MIPQKIQDFIDHQVSTAGTDYSDLRAVVVERNAEAIPGSEPDRRSRTGSTNIMEALGVTVDIVRTVDHVIPPGLDKDMREHGWDRDDFPPSTARRSFQPTSS